MFVFSVIPPVLAWLSMNMSALPLTEEGTQADATTQPTSSTTEAVPSKPLLLGAQLGTWAIPLINPFMVHALCHVGALPTHGCNAPPPHTHRHHMLQ